MADLLILTADELKALNSLERQAARRAPRQQPLTRLVLRTFLQQGGSIPVEDIIAASPGVRSDALHDALIARDDEDLIQVRAGQMDLAYPCQRPPHTEPPGSGKLSHSWSPILSQAGSPILSHPGSAIWSHPVERDRIPSSFSPSPEILAGAHQLQEVTSGGTEESGDRHP